LLAVVLLCLITEISFILVKKNRDVTADLWHTDRRQAT